MKKRGGSHIEIILSFVLFAGFIVFVFVFFGPSRSNVVEGGADYAFLGVLNEIESDVYTYTVKLNQPVLAGLENPDLVGIVLTDSDNSLSGLKVRVEDPDGNRLNATRFLGGKIVVDVNGGEEYLQVKFSESYTEDLLGEAGESLDAYEISSGVKNRVVLEEKVETLKNEYESDYNALRERIGIPVSSSFAFTLELEGKEISAEISRPDGVDIFSESRRVEIIRSGGVSEYADLIVRAW